MALLAQDATLAEKAKHAATIDTPLRTWLHSHDYRLDIIHVPRSRV